MLKSNYAPMNDHAIGENTNTVTGVAAAKFCSFGLVASKKWFSCFVVIGEGVVKVYDSEESYHNNPMNHVLLISLSRNHRASEIKRKNYSQESRSSKDFYCFYIEVENGLFSPTRELKLGFLNERTAESLRQAVNSNSRGI